MTDFFSAVSNFGFPIVLAGYLLFRFENKIERFSTKMDKFSDAIEGKPSEGKFGLINTINSNTEVTKNLAKEMNKLVKKIK